MIKKIYNLYMRKYKPVEYARKVGAKIGKNTRIIGMPDLGSEPWLISIGDHVTVSSDVRFVNHDGATWVCREEPGYEKVVKFGRIIIGNNCFIGTRSTMLPGVTIGNDCIVGACSLVTKSIPDGQVWGGVPAKFIMTTEEYKKRVLQTTPDYDLENFQRNKREETYKIADAIPSK